MERGTATVRVLRFPVLDALGRARERTRQRLSRLRFPPAATIEAVPAIEPAEAVEAVEAPTARVAARFHAAATLAAVAVALVGYHVLLGWVFDIPLLRTPAIGPPMTPSEALSALLSGVALYALRRPPGARRPGAESLAGICAAGVTALGLFALVEHAMCPGFGCIAPPDPAASMALSSSLAFVVLGGALLSLEARKIVVEEVLALVAGVIALQALTGYLYAARPFVGQMPLYAAIATMLAAVGLLFVRAEDGFMAKVASNSFGGLMARRLLPAAVIIPIALGWLHLHGQRLGLYFLEPGLTLFALANVAFFVGVVWWSVNSLYRMDGQRRQAERELKETAAKLQRSNADLEQFAYVTSHDLKEPLRAISGSVQVLQARFGGQLEPEAEEFIRHTVDGANRMQTLIDDLLTYSRLTTREAPLQPTNCGEVLREAIGNLAVPIKESRAVVTFDSLPTVPADRTQLLQVFQNLISNALKYRSERTPKIHVTVEDRGHEWQFSVRDNGIGIAPQYTDRIFKIFQRLHTRMEYPGTGIGLAVCKKVIERHGGRIWVESEPEEGSTFFFTLPK